ncbi:MAG: cell division protein FtsL [Rhodoferax sp.]|uniref:cell division protein FtsL n=1 Tax=Rhodoferax sp. TaxID=50421 RepID=UPI001401B6D4|nr:cell division protein FtsL [Rhodoferax sp.]NDP40379.1 cell division protein FtsL [Rhodoferax sp.]
MIRINLVLLLAVLASALYLVNVQYESRRLFSALDQANSEARRLEADNERLQVERRAQATPARVERLAMAKLQMRTTTPAITHYVTYGSVVPAAGLTPADPASSHAGSATGARIP